MVSVIRTWAVNFASSVCIYNCLYCSPHLLIFWGTPHCREYRKGSRLPCCDDFNNHFSFHNFTLYSIVATKRISAKMGIKTVVGGVSDPILTRMAEEDKVKWWKKPNLRIMYIYLFLCCMGVEMTSGFDSTLIGVLQFSDPWNACKLFWLANFCTDLALYFRRKNPQITNLARHLSSFQ